MADTQEQPSTSGGGVTTWRQLCGACVPFIRDGSRHRHIATSLRLIRRANDTRLSLPLAIGGQTLAGSVPASLAPMTG